MRLQRMCPVTNSRPPVRSTKGGALSRRKQSVRRKQNVRIANAIFKFIRVLHTKNQLIVATSDQNLLIFYYSSTCYYSYTLARPFRERKATVSLAIPL
jgi:hypothetical protein